ncbi:MAG TPA: ABC-F family ATP-binding cassette domain-containing protein [Chitinophagaceae bacterium]|nr:ABC-F family ATP-binding cassette domain-containing protein [Chitinophagaceae bacterium]
MLISLQNIHFEYGARVIVADASWPIMPGERIGLIGLNGTGKSTLLHIINGDYRVSAGSVDRAKNLTIGFFNQDLLSLETEASILSVAMTAFDKVIQLEKEIEAITNTLASGENETLLHLFSDKLHELEALDGYHIRHRSEAILEGLGFSTQDLSRPYHEFSGGWRMRVLLAKMILQQPDLLMLDEPTNHLDLPSIEWLERYLVHYQGSVIIVSHDRYFLDRMVTKIVELYQEQLHLYSGNYSFYEQEKLLRREGQKRAYDNQQEYIRQQERFIERFRSKATKAAQAQSALKRLDKMERIEEVDRGAARIRISFSVEKIPGKMLCTLKGISKQFGEIRVLDQADAEIARGDKIALIGANGKGKSTLLRIIAGTEPCSGERKPGHQVVTSFYAQHQLEALHLENNVLDELKGCGSGKTEQELRNLLGCFLFSGDDVFKKIRILSGGEKARVALAKTIISRANFLLLDEPTNHLDMNSVEMLIGALHQYEGSYILVSHDRYFVQQTANRIWEIMDGRIIDFQGSFAEWETWKASKTPNPEEKMFPPEGKTAVPAPEISRDVVLPFADLNKGATKGLRDTKKELQKQQRIFQDLENRMTKMQAEKASLESILATPGIYADKQRFLECESRYQVVLSTLETANREFELVFERILNLESSTLPGELPVH